MGRLGRPVLLRALTWATLVLAGSSIFELSPPEEPPRYCTVFNHIPKSGGSSVKNQLTHSSHTAGCDEPGLITGVQRATPAMRLDIVYNSSVIVGYTEMVRIALEEAGRECDFFTVIRHPIDRLVSNFYYCPTDHDVQHRASKWCGDSKGQTVPVEDRFMEYAKAMANPLYRLMIHSFLCNPAFELCDDLHARPMPKLPRDLTTEEGREIHAGIERILATYTAVGIFEKWELSMRLFDATIKSPVRQWDASYAANSGSRSPEREALLKWAHTNVDLHAIVSADLLLYEFAYSVFQQQTKVVLGVEWT